MVLLKFTSTLEKHAASIFRAKAQKSKRNTMESNAQQTGMCNETSKIKS